MEKRMKIMVLILITGLPLVCWLGMMPILRTKYPMIVVYSDSMKPTLNTGDIVIVQGIDTAAVKGEIIAFHSPKLGESIIYVHRVVDVRQENGKSYFLTRGDANDDSDSWLIPENHVIGKVVGKIPFLGYIATIPRMYLVILGALLIVIDRFMTRQKMTEFLRK